MQPCAAFEFGFEIWNGGHGMAVNSFNAAVTPQRSVGTSIVGVVVIAGILVFYTPV